MEDRCSDTKKSNLQKNNQQNGWVLKYEAKLINKQTKPFHDCK